MTLHSFTTSEAIKTGWNLTKKYFWVIMLLSAIVYLPSLFSIIFDMILQYIPGATELVTNPNTNISQYEPIGVRAVISAIIAIVTGILGAWLGLGLISTNFMILNDQKPTTKDLITTPRIYVARLIGGSILIGLAVIVGFIALIIPGIYLAVRLSMFKYLIVEGYSTMDAIKGSRAITNGQVMKLIGAGLAAAGISILGFLALLVGLLWAMPTVMLMQASIYTHLKKNLPHDIKPLKE